MRRVFLTPHQRAARKHSLTGEKFRDMEPEKLRAVLRRTYKFAADSVRDQRYAQRELQHRRGVMDDLRKEGIL